MSVGVKRMIIVEIARWGALLQVGLSCRSAPILSNRSAFGWYPVSFWGPARGPDVDRCETDDHCGNA